MVNIPKRYKRKINIFWLAFLCLTPIVLLTLPADFFDSGTTVCLSKSLFDTECYGCGLTRASMHLIHFDIETAKKANSLSLVVAPLLSFIWLREAVRILRILRTKDE